MKKHEVAVIAIISVAVGAIALMAARKKGCRVCQTVCRCFKQKLDLLREIARIVAWHSASGAASIGIIGSSDGPTAIFTSGSK